MKVGDVAEIPLPDGRFAYGRIYRDASIGIYHEVSEKPGQPPIGSREFLFTVGVYTDVLDDWRIVGRDPFKSADSEWPPPMVVKDVITGIPKIYHKGEIKDATSEECKGLEEASVWDSHHIIDRIVKELSEESLSN